MSLTRKQLSDWGITGEVADLIINAHVETVDAVKAERDNYASKSVELAVWEDTKATLNVMNW